MSGMYDPTTKEQADANKLAQGCLKHRAYTMMRPPRCDCKRCEEIYEIFWSKFIADVKRALNISWGSANAENYFKFRP